MVLVTTFGGSTLLLFIEFETRLFLPEPLRVGGSDRGQHLHYRVTDLGPISWSCLQVGQLTAILGTESMTDDRASQAWYSPFTQPGTSREGLETIAELMEDIKFLRKDEIMLMCHT